MHIPQPCPMQNSSLLHLWVTPCSAAVPHPGSTLSLVTFPKPDICGNSCHVHLSKKHQGLLRPGVPLISHPYGHHPVDFSQPLKASRNQKERVRDDTKICRYSELSNYISGFLNFQHLWKKWKFNFRKLKNQHFIFWPSILKCRIRLRINF